MTQGVPGQQGEPGVQGEPGERGRTGARGPGLVAGIGLILLGLLAGVAGMALTGSAGDEAQTLTAEQHILLQQSPAQWTGLPTSPMPVDQHPDYYNFTFDYQPPITDYTKPVPMLAHHSSSCGGPPDNQGTPNNSPLHTHPISTFADSIFVCNNHLMLAVSAGTAYAEIGMIPNRILDFTNGGTVQWEQSTFLSTSSNREWLDIFLTPFDQTVGYSDDRITPPIGPRTGLQIRNLGGYHLNRWDNFVKEAISPCCRPTIDGVQGVDYVGADGIVPGTNQSATRQSFKLTISRTAAKLERLQSNTAGAQTYFNVSFNPPLSFTQAVVKFGQHSYDPPKGCSEGANPCDPGTWHWDEMHLSPSVPFTAIKGNQHHIDSANPTVTFPQPAPVGAYIRYITGFNHELSFNGGQSWVIPRITDNAVGNELPHSVMHLIPAGTTSARIRFPSGCGPWPCVAHSFSIWAQTGGTPSTPIPATATRSPMPPMPSQTPIITSTPMVTTPTPTSVVTVIPATPLSTSSPQPTVANTPMSSPTTVPVPACWGLAGTKLGPYATPTYAEVTCLP